MKIVLGLGNPGSEYANTRHNAGAMFVERLAVIISYQLSVISTYGWRKHKGMYIWEDDNKHWLLVKPQEVFMNESGRMIREIVANCQLPIEQLLKSLYVAHDDLDIRLGECKIQLGKGPKDHNGMKSIEDALKTSDFWRIRIGIDNRSPEIKASISGEEYVLQRFSIEEKGILSEIMDRTAAEMLQ